MIDADVAVQSLVTIWQSCPNLISFLGGNPSVVMAYQDLYPTQSSVTDTTFDPPPTGLASYPSIIVVYQGMVSGTFDQNISWRHRFSAFIRAPRWQFGFTMANPYTKILQLMLNDVPSFPIGNTLPVKEMEILPDLYPFNPVASGEIQYLRIVNGTEDFFELRFFLTEIGDV